MTDVTTARVLDRPGHEAPAARPAAPATDAKQARLIAFSSGLGFLFDAYVVYIYSFVLPLIVISFSLSTTVAGGDRLGDAGRVHARHFRLWLGGRPLRAPGHAGGLDRALRGHDR